MKKSNCYLLIMLILFIASCSKYLMNTESFVEQVKQATPQNVGVCV